MLSKLKRSLLSLAVSAGGAAAEAGPSRLDAPESGSVALSPSIQPSLRFDQSTTSDATSQSAGELPAISDWAPADQMLPRALNDGTFSSLRATAVDSPSQIVTVPLPVFGVPIVLACAAGGVFAGGRWLGLRK